MSGRITEFDGLRGLLSIIVVAGHTERWLFPWFWGVMEVFYALSGFLIVSIVLRNQGRPGFIKTYFLKRALRIWPLYFLVLLFCVLFQLSLQHAGFLTSQYLGAGFIRSIFFLQNVELLAEPGSSFSTTRHDYPAGFDHSWSVALEEQFYVLALLALFATPRLLKTAVVLLVLASIASLSLRLLEFHFWLLPARVDAFAGGSALALLYRWKPDARAWGFAKPVAAVSAVVIAAMYLCDPVYLDDYDYQWFFAIGVSVFAIFATALVAFLLTHQESESGIRFLRWRWLRFLGEASYSTYLWHMPVLWYLEMFVPYVDLFEGIPQSLIAVPIVFWVSIASHLLIERPIESVRSRLKS